MKIMERQTPRIRNSSQTALFSPKFIPLAAISSFRPTSDRLVCSPQGADASETHPKSLSFQLWNDLEGERRHRSRGGSPGTRVESSKRQIRS